ncbi:cupin domain-containing protein [Mycobacteriaceae bacterium NPDC060252]
MHTTPTVDLIYIVSGEIYAVLEDSESKLSAGDLFVQRGTKHAWSNRSSEPAVMFVVLISAEG